MTRNKFIGLIFMMLVSLAGIIWVQIWWIRNALAIRNENFNRAVFAGLNDAASTIESNREMSFFFEDPMLYNSNQAQGDVSSYLSIGSYSSDGGNRVNYSITNQTVTGTIDSTGKMRFNKPMITRKDTTINANSGVVTITTPQKPGELHINGNNPGLNGNEGPVTVNRQEFLDWVKRRASQFQNMSNEMISEVYQWEKTMDLNKDEVNYALRRSFLFWGIETPYDFALIKNGKIERETSKKMDQADFLKSSYKVQLFPDNIINQNLLLSVVFPQRTNYVLGSMAWILGGSMLFSLIMLATFGLSLYFIIHQKKVSEMKSDFLNNMTHEFKTPIATISLAADTITNPKVINDEASIKHFIGMIKKENSRMNKKVETILQIASLDKKEIAFKFENLSMHSVIERAVETIEIQVHQKNGKINLNLNAEEPVIYGDYEHLTNLVNNLLDNALKYSPESPEITVATWNNEKGLILSVQDNGIGMTKSAQSKIFERFYRQTSGNIHDVKGFGLGLNYVRAIIEAHKGNVTVTSEPGRGSRFDIFLPFNWENQG
ncbi:MAG: HAMP domain-containing sensor histidine kinase [Bacteroidota bacterium]|nr:HAMP domain-containing sensor histidine kinase [Bacteroidota bacterium]